MKKDSIGLLLIVGDLYGAIMVTLTFL